MSYSFIIQTHCNGCQGDIKCSPSSHLDFIKNYFLSNSPLPPIPDYLILMLILVFINITLIVVIFYGNNFQERDDGLYGQYRLFGRLNGFLVVFSLILKDISSMLSMYKITYIVTSDRIRYSKIKIYQSNISSIHCIKSAWRKGWRPAWIRVLSISSRRSQTLSHFGARACRSQNEFEVKDNQHLAELHKA